MIAVRSNNEEIVQRLIEKGAAINERVNIYNYYFLINIFLIMSTYIVIWLFVICYVRAGGRKLSGLCLSGRQLFDCQHYDNGYELQSYLIL